MPGHQSVLIRLPVTGNVLLTIDAAPFQHLFTADLQAEPLGQKPDDTQRSVEKLIQLAKAEDALVIFGHDDAQWNSLRKLPEFYS